MKLNSFEYLFAVLDHLFEFFHSLKTFALLFGDGVLESIIENLMRLSRDYRYVAYILTTEKGIHKEMSVRIKVSCFLFLV